MKVNQCTKPMRLKWMDFSGPVIHFVSRFTAIEKKYMLSSLKEANYGLGGRGGI